MVSSLLASRWVDLLGILLALISSTAAAGNIPSESRLLFQTDSGYDRLHGRDAICWQTSNTTSSDSSSILLMRSCPRGHSLRAAAPLAEEGKRRLRTGSWYNYQANLSLNRTSTLLGGNVTARVIACRVGVSGGLCSPFSNTQQRDNNYHLAVLQSEEIVRGLRPTDEGQEDDALSYQYQIDIPMQVDTPGDFVVIVALELVLEEEGRIHMANALQPSALVSYQAPTQILVVSSGVRAVGYSAVALATGVLLWLLSQTIRHRHHVSLRMAQGRFLVVWLLAGLSAVLCAVLLEPRNDLYCQWGLPTVLVSLQLFYAITVGRVWRINSVVSPAILQAMDWKQPPLWIQRVFFDSLRKCTACLLKWDNATRPKRLRKEFSEKQLVLVVFLFTLPQVILQALVVLYQPWQLAMDLTEDESMGRQYCALPEDLPFGASIFYYGVYIFALLLVVLFIMARAARRLPSLFNESKIIFDSLLSSLFLLIMGLGVIFGTSSPTTSPSISYLMCLVMILFVVLQSSLRLMIPKLKLAWRNEVIIVSDLMSEHTQQVREKQARRSGNKLANGVGLDSSSGHIPRQSNHHVRVSGLNPQETQYCKNHAQRRSYSTSTVSAEAAEKVFQQDISQTTAEFTRSGSFRVRCQSTSHLQDSSGSVVRYTSLSPERSNHSGPPLEVVLKALDLESHLAKIQKQVVSGLQVGAEDWQKVRELSREMEGLFAETDEEAPPCRAEVNATTPVEEGKQLDDNAQISPVNGMESDGVISHTGRRFLHQQPGNRLLEVETALATLGDGPMRFANPRRSVHVQVSNLSRDDQESYRLLRSDLVDAEKENTGRNLQAEFFSGEVLLRFLRRCSEDGDAKRKQLATWRAMQKFDIRYLSLTARSLEQQLLTKTLFPIPGVKTLDGGNPMFYMRPCRYNPTKTPTSLIIDNLVYCMQTMLEDESACTNGIGFVACMDDWKMKHFSTDYCFQFMQALQGHTTPVHVTHFLIVNPPAWFGKIWNIMKTMLSVEFQKKVHMIPECQLSNFLEPGYEELLPDDMVTGEAPTDEMVQDWVTFRKFIEGPDREDYSDEGACSSSATPEDGKPAARKERPLSNSLVSHNRGEGGQRRSFFRKSINRSQR